MKMRLAAAVMAVCMLSGCAYSGENTTSDGSITAENSADMTENVNTAPLSELFEPVHDLDPQAMERGGDGMPYFSAAECEEVEFYPSEDAVKRCGRYIEYNGICYLSYTCSAVSFVMTGDRVEAVMTSNGNVYADNQQCWVGVLINGELKKRICLDPGDNTYTLYEGDMLTGAEITIIKLTENQMATAGIKSITANAKRIAPKSENDLSIEFIGDSITCGYGNEADSPSDGYDSAQQNGLKTYGYYTAQALNADYSMVSISGIGLISDYTGRQGVKEDYLLMPDVYDYSDANFQMRRGIDEMIEWGFGGGSDIVVINLGTNDYSYTGRDGDLQAEFENAYYKFIGQVRERNPHAEIICTMGIMGAELFGNIEAAAAAYAADTGDEHIHTMKFDYQSEEDGFGGDYHPTAATHKKAAEKLTDYIRTLM